VFSSLELVHQSIKEQLRSNSVASDAGVGKTIAGTMVTEAGIVKEIL